MSANHGLTDETVAQIHEVHAHHPEVEKVVLYGSRAKGNFKPGSDVDRAGEDQVEGAEGRHREGDRFHLRPVLRRVDETIVGGEGQPSHETERGDSDHGAEEPNRSGEETPRARRACSA